MMKNKHFILDPDDGLVINLTDSRLFSGLNNTIWLNKNHYQKTIDEYLTKYPNYRANDLDFSIDIEKYLKEIAKVYCKYFNKHLGGKWKLYSLYSPPYYDFVTDEIVLHCAEPTEEILQNAAAFEEEIIDTQATFEKDIIFQKQLGFKIYDKLVTVSTGDVILEK